jgi:hypothetical protein
VKLRILFEDGTRREYDANRTDVMDGWLQLSQFHVKRAVIAGQPDEVSSRLVGLWRRDQVRMVEVVDAGEPEIVEVGKPNGALSRVN